MIEDLATELLEWLVSPGVLRHERDGFVERWPVPKAAAFIAAAALMLWGIIAGIVLLLIWL